MLADHINICSISTTVLQLPHLDSFGKSSVTVDPAVKIFSIHHDISHISKTLLQVFFISTPLMTLLMTSVSSALTPP